VGSAWIEWRRLHRTPPPPADLSLAAADTGPLAEIVVRDEAELARLRAEVRRLQTALAETLPADDRGRFEAQIRELEARLAEAGDEGAVAPGAPGDAGGDAEGTPVGDAGAGMQIGERRTRASLEAAPEPPTPPASGAPAPSPSASEPASAPGTAPVLELPRLLRAIRPAYPRIARERRITATVELKVRVDAAGKVLAAEPVGPPAGFGFDESARAAAMSAQFRPGRRNGVAVEMELRLAIRFLLEVPPR